MSRIVKGRRGGWEDVCGVAASGQSEGCSEWEASLSKAPMRGGSPCVLSYIRIIQASVCICMKP